MPSRVPGRSASSLIEKLQILKSHPLFANISPELLARLCTYATTRRIKRGEVIFSRGDPGTGLFIVASGSVKISVQSAGGKDAVFNLIEPGSIFGEIALLDGQPRTADAIALTNCQLVVLERREFVPLVLERPEIALRIIEVLCQRLRRTSDQLEDMMFLDLQHRLAKALLRLSDATRDGTPGRKVAITQRELGQIIGMSRESTNKQLRVWEERKWLKIERGAITILRPQALAQVAAEMEKA